MIFFYSDGPNNKLIKNTLFCIWLCLATSVFNKERNQIISNLMPNWYLEYGDYIYLILAAIWISKSIWKVKPKHIVYNLLFAIALWLFPFASSFLEIKNPYITISIMLLTPLLLIMILHKRSILPEYQT